MSYRRRATQQYGMRRRAGEATLKSFTKVFDRSRYGARRNSLIRDVDQQLKKMKDEEFSEFYENLVGRKPDLGISYDVTINPERSVAIIPFGLKKGDAEQERTRRNLLKLLSQSGKKVKAESIADYTKKAKNGTVKIGEASFNLENVVSALRVLGKDTYVYKPKKDMPLILENENEDRIFIAPVISYEQRGSAR